jgi:hypothetical protein
MQLHVEVCGAFGVFIFHLCVLVLIGMNGSKWSSTKTQKLTATQAVRLYVGKMGTYSNSFNTSIHFIFRTHCFLWVIHKLISDLRSGRLSTHKTHHVCASQSTSPETLVYSACKFLFIYYIFSCIPKSFAMFFRFF